MKGWNWRSDTIDLKQPKNAKEKEGEAKWRGPEESEEVEENERKASPVFIHAPGALVAAFIFKIELNKQQAAHPKKHSESITARLSDFCDGWGLQIRVLPIHRPS